MTISQDHIHYSTPMGANIVETGGCTFKFWAPAAKKVYLTGNFNQWKKDNTTLLSKSYDGYWTGYASSAKDGDEYLFYVHGEGSEGKKRDPYARELTLNPAWPHCHCLIRDPNAYPWHDQNFHTPNYHNMIIYQLHCGCYYGPDRPNRVAKFLDVVNRVEYLSELGITALQLLPVVEFQTMFSMGYNGTDYFSPEMDYEVHDPDELKKYLKEINRLLANKGHSPLKLEHCLGSSNQLKILVDLFHVYGMAVILDVVYNHAGGDFGDESMYFADRQDYSNQNNSLYFTEQGWAGGLVFAFWKKEVRQFLIDNAIYYLQEVHMDGLRYDEVSVIDHKSTSGWGFCQDLTQTIRYVKPQALQNAEYWPVNPAIVKPVHEGGAGFDTTQHDGLREAVRSAIKQASYGADAKVDMKRIGDSLQPSNFAKDWQYVTCVENHDRVYKGRENRLPALADPSNHRSWYARSRSRVATAILMTSPGIPMIFMGQELLEDKQWHDSRSPSHLVWWGGLEKGDKSTTDHLRFTQEIIRLRHQHPALRKGKTNVYHCHNDNRILAYHRWLEGQGEDIVILVNLKDQTYYEYQVGFPRSGKWKEIFNSDIYDHYVNPWGLGNGGEITTHNTPRHNMPCSASIVLPANSLLAFTFKHS